MATANISWTPCGSSSDGQYLYYGKTTIATGTPVSGTGWTLYSGVPLTNTANTVTINGLDDNVEYTFYIYCHCPSAGNGPLISSDPIIKYICPTFSNVVPTYNGVSYNLTIPISANNSGSWIQKVLVSVYDSSNLNLLYTNTYTQPFANVSGSFTSLSSSTNYNLQISYTNNAGTKSNNCISVPFTTAAACVAPMVTVNNPTANTFDVNWTPSTGGTFDILVNNSVVATGLTVSPYTVTGLSPATIYQANVRKNCTTGGTAVSTTQNITTTNAPINGILSFNVTPSPANNYLIFTFPMATAFPITVYVGNILQIGSNLYAEGYSNLFSLPPGVVPFGTPAGPPLHPNPVIFNIPQGVTTFTTSTPYFYPDGSGWQLISPSIMKDIYIKVNSPSGYNANFTIANGFNHTTNQATTGINIHNV